MTQTNWMDKTVCLIIGPKLEAEVARLTEERDALKKISTKAQEAATKALQQNARLREALEEIRDHEIQCGNAYRAVPGCWSIANAALADGEGCGDESCSECAKHRADGEGEANATE